METSEVQPALIFIPDISGFTEFVNNTEIIHAQHIISESLEIIIDSNEIGLEVSEIEGDAVLFYRFGKAPTSAELLAQIQKMFVNFHANLKIYETQRICQCGACSGAVNLTLKFITHYGELMQEQIKSHTKLFGKDLIVAHRLMKNKVPDTQYSLITHELLNACSAWVDMKEAAWAPPVEGEETYDFGTSKYCYFSMKELESHIPEPRIEDYGIKGANKKIVDLERVVEAPIEFVFDILSDYSIKAEWMTFLKTTDMLNSKIAKNGSMHRCVINGDQNDPVVVAHNFKTQKDLITYHESDQKAGLMNVVTIRKIGPAVTRLHVQTYLKVNFIQGIRFDLFRKKKMEYFYDASYDSFCEYCKKLINEKKDAPSSVLLEPA